VSIALKLCFVLGLKNGVDGMLAWAWCGENGDVDDAVEGVEGREIQAMACLMPGSAMRGCRKSDGDTKTAPLPAICGWLGAGLLLVSISLSVIVGFSSCKVNGTVHPISPRNRQS